jgi:ribosome biogenesis GTPase A
MPDVLNAEIQWYPGHMAQAMRKLGERLRIVDVLIEVLDARLPRASSNPALDRLAPHKPRIVVLGREDLADPHATRDWLAWYEHGGRSAVAVNGKDQTAVKRVSAALAEVASSRGRWWWASRTPANPASSTGCCAVPRRRRRTRRE